MRTRWVGIAVLLAGCSGDPWVGSYDGTSFTEGRSCAGVPFDPASSDVTVSVQRDDTGLFVNGRCLIRLEELSDTEARVVPTTCDTTLDDGTPATVEIVNGRASLDGDEFALEYSSALETPEECATATTMFVGTRR
jgi:hypothetical protein